ncbi:porin [Mycolicibacterium sp. P9-64]|uniref:MspA family porin n=1 Tax=Mycolicibacterium sp. P9-64 TaxID=2024612 RepID=UPI0011ED083E|nr:MspA family porin [Mycolicibacterium sp. P9-64]KAA0084584.1 porin [Mycolicibacterium sp. P9-64]
MEHELIDIGTKIKALGHTLLAAIVFATTSYAGAGHAHATMDNELSTVDGLGRTLVVQQLDTFLNGVPPLDRNRLTREWYQTGRARYTVSGADADKFAGTLEIGYQVGFPWSLGIGVNFSYTTPNLLLDDASIAEPPLGIGFNPLGSVITPNLFPGVSISADLGNGPGIQEVSTFSLDVTGPAGGLVVANAHGTVTGAAGGVLLRPFARLVSNAGDSVTTYGEPWNMN